MPHGEGVVEAEARGARAKADRACARQNFTTPLSACSSKHFRSRRLLPLCLQLAVRRAPCGRGSQRPRWPTNMGKIIRGPEAWSQVKLSTRRVGGGGACSEEFAAYLTCLDKTQANEEECKTLREALRRCMYVASSGARTSRHVVPINYHLQKVRRRIA